MDTTMCENVKNMLEQLFPEIKKYTGSFDEDLGSFFDSVKFVSFIMSIENKFNFSISDDDFVLDKFSSIRKIADLINSYLLKKKDA